MNKYNDSVPYGDLYYDYINDAVYEGLFAMRIEDVKITEFYIKDNVLYGIVTKGQVKKENLVFLGKDVS